MINIMSRKDYNTLNAIRHMLRNDERTRRHWYYNTIMVMHENEWVKEVFQKANREKPCGAVGCAWGHAERLGIVPSIGWEHHLKSLREGDADFIFSNFSVSVDDQHVDRKILGMENMPSSVYALAITPDTVAARIDHVIDKYVIEQE